MAATKTRRKMYSQRFTDEERAAYREAQRDEAQRNLETAVAELQSAEGFRRWMDARARFHDYSFNNVLLIVSQCPDATRVASAKVWKELGRYPAKGSHAIRVFAPIEWWVPCEQSAQGARWSDRKKRWERKVRSFKLVPVFDISQTAGDDLPEAVEPESVDGDTHAHLEPALITLAEEQGYSVDSEALGATMGGYCDPTRKRIVLNEDLAPNGRVRVLVHELAHALGIGYAEYGRAMAEVLVEAVTYIVLAGQGLAVDASSVPYVAGWAGSTDVATALRTFAAKVDEVARTIEGAL